MKKIYTQPQTEVLLPIVDNLMAGATISPGPATEGPVDAPARTVPATILRY